ncbi:MAG: gamma-glutamyltransferase [Bdellovibrionaceae bacterium]|nr:gamma-glutamyltransferase [Pseudobdellovibrionaceae bacterium]
MKKIILSLFIIVLSGQRALSSKKVGVVSAGNPMATQIGFNILKAGGNAYAAAIGSVIGITYSDPMNTSLAGKSQILIYTSKKQFIGIDAASQTPKKSVKNPSEMQRIPIPGLPKAIEEVLKLSNFSLEQILGFVLPELEKGVKIGRNQAVLLGLKRDLISRKPELKKIFMKDGKTLKYGETFKVPDFIKTLEIIKKEGFSTFYTGSIASKIVEDHKLRGGLLTKSDLENYKINKYDTYQFDLGDVEVHALKGNTWGHVLIQMLNMQKKSDSSKSIPKLISLIKIEERVMEDQPFQKGLRHKYLQEYDYNHENLLSKAYYDKALPKLKKELKKVKMIKEDGDTSHISIIDSEKNAVSWTLTLGPWFGLGEFIPGTGVLYPHSAFMQHSPRPNIREHTNLVPTIVLKNKEPYLVIGSAGSERIVVSIFQVLYKFLFEKKDLRTAIFEPRFFSFKKWIRIQKGFPQNIINILKNNNYQIETVWRNPVKNLGFVYAAKYDNNTYFGVADPTYDGLAIFE